MAGHGGRLPSSGNGQSNSPGFVLPLSSHRLNGWRRFLTSLSPYVSRSSGRTLRVYARRLLTENESQRDILSSNATSAGERHNLLGVWSPSNRINDSNSVVTNQDDFLSLPLQENDNVVINIESNSAREQYRQTSSSSHEDLNENVFQTPSRNSDADTGILPINPDSENSNEAEDPQETEEDHGLSINGEPITDILDRHPELKNVLKVVWQYCIFVLIIVTKIVYDRFSSLLILLTFFVGFIFSNKIVKLSVSHQERRSKRLALALLSVMVCIPLGIYLFYHKASTRLYYSAMLLPSDNNFLSLGEVLWVVIVTDFVLKLTSIFIKGIFALLPTFVIHYKHRGKHLAMIEFTSQLYRSLAPVQPWISYLLDDYTGIQKVFGVFLSAMYMLCKGPDIIYRVKNFHFVLKKLQDSKYGSIPSKGDLDDCGSLCPICQDNLVLPTMLQCRHIFCEQCVARWFDRERTCPMCRTKIADDPSYRDGSTSYAIQFY